MFEKNVYNSLTMMMMAHEGQIHDDKRIFNMFQAIPICAQSLYWMELWWLHRGGQYVENTSEVWICDVSRYQKVRSNRMIPLELEPIRGKLCPKGRLSLLVG